MFSFTLYRLPFTSVGLMLRSPKSWFASVYIHREGLFMNWLCTVGVIPFTLSCMGCMSDIFTVYFNILNADVFLHVSSQSDGLIVVLQLSYGTYCPPKSTFIDGNPCVFTCVLLFCLGCLIHSARMF